MTRAPKKDDTLEIRLSSEEKVALQTQARLEGRSVSEIVRGLIARYLKSANARTLVMRHPRFAALAAASLVMGLVIMFAAPARARDLSLGVAASIESVETGYTAFAPDPAAPNTRFDIVYGRPTLLCAVGAVGETRIVASADNKTCGADPQSIGLMVWAQAVPNETDYVMVGVRILESDAISPMTPVGPTMMVKFGETAGIATNLQDRPDHFIRVSLFANHT